VLPWRTKPLELTPRERQICELICKGAETKEIALELHMAVRTVKAHIGRIYWRNGIRDGIRRVKLAVHFFRETEGKP
jgi:DNA-binding NarL/FixJ family response regulator